MPCYLPLHPSRLGMRLLNMDCEYRNFYLIHPWRPKCKLEELSNFSLPQNETCLSPPLVIDEMRQLLLQVLLQRQEELIEVEVQLVEDFVELATKLGENPFEPNILAWKHQYKPILNSQILLLGLCLEKYGTEACSSRLEELLATVRPHSQISMILRGSESLNVSVTELRRNVILIYKNIREGDHGQINKNHR